MTQRTRVPGAVVLVALLITAAASSAQSTAASAPSTSPNQPQPVIMLVPVQISTKELEAGCWVQLYDERNFKGNMLTIVGPVELQSLDKSSGRHFKRSIDSMVTGPKATVEVYEHQMFKDKSARFEPNSKEPGLIRKLGFGGRIESMKLSCAS